MAVAEALRAGRRRARSPRERARDRQGEPPLQGARLRPEARAERRGRAGLRRPRLALRRRTSSRGPASRSTSSRRAIDKELAKVRAEKVTDEELSRAKNGFETAFVRGLESVRERASLLNMYQAELGDPGYVQKDLARYRRATSDGIKELAAKVLDPNARVIIRVVPKNAESEMKLALRRHPRRACSASRRARRRRRPVAAARAARVRAPSAAARRGRSIRSARSPTRRPPRRSRRPRRRCTRRRTGSRSGSSSGTRCRSSRSPSRPAGAAADPKEKHGLAWATANMLDEGAGKRGSLALASRSIARRARSAPARASTTRTRRSRS